MGEKMERMISEIKNWLQEAGKMAKTSHDTITVAQKTNRTDLVTNADREIQTFLIEKIHTFDPKAKILAEEEGCSELESLDGRVFIIDPIDGTLNFVVEGENFCIMLAVYEDGIGKLGFIYDVMQEELYWGGPGIGVYKNDERLPQPIDKPLSEGLLGVNSYLFGHNKFHVREIGEKSMGVRMYGCAGLELVAMLKGNHIGYISNLSPWDYAAGNVLLEEFGMKYSNLSGGPLRFNGREYYIGGTSRAYSEMLSHLSVNRSDEGEKK